jgi:hypothetical protein
MSLSENVHKIGPCGAAWFSADGTRRYKLERFWGDETPETINFVMMNPSTADERKDDPTIRKCVGFAKGFGYERIVVTNLIPVISTLPYSLPTSTGRDEANEAVLRHAASTSDFCIVAWGSIPPGLSMRIGWPEYVRAFRIITADLSPKVHCLGLTRSGDPRHPSRLSYETPLEQWD